MNRVCLNSSSLLGVLLSLVLLTGAGGPLFAQAQPPFQPPFQPAFPPPAGGGLPGAPPLNTGPDAGGPLKLQWEEIDGANGYMVEIQDGSGQTVIRRQTTKNSINFGLPLGEYKQRIGVLNKFKKVSVWTAWQPLRIQRPGSPVITSISPARVAVGQKNQAFEIRGKNIFRGSKVSIIRNGVLVPFTTRDARTGEINLRLNTTTVQPGAYSVIVENSGGKRTRSTQDLKIVRTGRDGKLLSDTPRWKKLIPGLHQYSSGDTVKGAAWMTTFAGLAIAGGVANVVANNATQATASDPLYNLVFNPVVLFALRDSIGSRRQGLILAAAANDRVIENRFVYNVANQVQTGVIGAAGLLYVLNYVDASDWDTSTAVPGAKTPAWRTTMYWTLFTGLAAGAATEYMAGEALLSAAANDPLISLYSNPIWSGALLSNQTRDSQSTLLAVLSSQRDAEFAARYAGHQQNQAAMGAAAALLYFGHFFDLSFSDAGLSMELQYVPEGLIANGAGGNEGFTGLTLRFVY